MARLVWDISGAPTPWLASRLGIHACRTRGGVTLFELLGYYSKLCHAPVALEREVYIRVVEAQ